MLFAYTWFTISVKPKCNELINTNLESLLPHSLIALVAELCRARIIKAIAPQSTVVHFLHNYMLRHFYRR